MSLGASFFLLNVISSLLPVLRQNFGCHDPKCKDSIYFQNDFIYTIDLTFAGLNGIGNSLLWVGANVYVK